MTVRKEAVQFTRDCDILLNGVNSQLTVTQLELLQAYTALLQEERSLNSVFPLDYEVFFNS